MKNFSIKIGNKVFESDEDGFLNLNIIHKALGLPTNKLPSQWRSKVRDYYEANANLHSLKNPNQSKGEAAYFMVATEVATIAYAMWVDIEFHTQVVEAFLNLRQGNIEEAINIAGNTMSDEDNYLLSKINEQKGLAWTKACWVANIYEPVTIMRYLAHKKKNWNYFAVNEHGKYYATQAGIDEGYFYNCYGSPDSSKVVMRVTKKGREEMKQNNEWFNMIANKAVA